MEGAREAVEQGRYGDAVKLLKQLLKQDRTNYEGFVLLGLALARGNQHLDQAEMSFNKAISLRSSALPAYQGLVELREASGTTEEKVASYKALASVAKDTGEFTLAVEFMFKAAKAKVDDHEQAKLLWEEALAMQLTDQQRLEALCCLVDAEAGIMEAKIQEYQKQASVNSAQAEDLRGMAELAWARSGSSTPLEEHTREIVGVLPYSERYQGLLLQLLINRVRASTGQEWKIMKEEMLYRSLVMLSFCPSKLAIEVLLVLAEEDDVDELFQGVKDYRITKGWLGKQTAHFYPGRGITLAATAAKFSRKHLAQRELLHDESSISGWRVLAQEYYKEGLFDKSLECADKSLSSVSLKRKLFGLSLKAAEQELRLLFADILFSRNNHNEASRLYQSVAEEAKALPECRRTVITRDAFKGLVRLSLAMKETEVAKSRLNDILTQDPENHWALSERGWLQYEARSLHQAKSDLEKAVSACQGSALYHYRLGRVYWEMDGMKGRALPEFLESAKLDPSQAKAFLYLGHYYKDVGNDLRRAIRCYQKAVSLDFENNSAGELLCDMLDNGGEYVLEKTICEEATSKSPRAFWAWRRLAFILAAQQAWSEAVRCAQNGLRGYPSDSHLWEALALSYKKLGMFSAALKAFGRASDLDKSNFFALTEIGGIQLTLQLYSKATDSYRQALDIHPDDLSAVYGLTSALLGQARECLLQGAFCWCTTLLKEAIELARRNKFLFGHLVSAWKQLGDASLMYAQALPFNAELLGENTVDVELQSAVKSWHHERLTAARNAVRAYKCAIHLLPSEGRFYRDMAVAIQYVCTLEKYQISAQWSEAETLALSGLDLDGANADMWVALGVVTRHKGLQQHAFIQALRLNANQGLAWAYLGQLYLSFQEKILAHVCFDRARSADPSIAITWAGMSALQGLYGRKDELLEAFTNCLTSVQLSSMVDVHGGVGQLAAQTQNLSSPQVNVALLQATERQPLHAAIHNLKGLSSESRSDFPSAIRAYEYARGAALLSSESSRLQNLITSNLARALSKAGYVDAAVSEYNKLFSTGASTDLDDLRGYAIALNNSGQGRKSELIVKKVLSRVSGNAQYVGTLLLLAKLTYFSQGPVTALMLLLETPSDLFSDKELSLTTLAIGVTTRNGNLVSAALNRCTSVFTSEFAPEAYILLGYGSQDLIKALHLHPHSDLLRTKLAQRILSQSNGQHSSLVESLCHSSMITSSDNLTGTLSSESLTDANLARFSPSLLGIQTLGELRRLVHMQPFNMEARYCLILFLVQETRRQDYPLFLCRTVSRMCHSTLLQLSSSYKHSYMRAQLKLCVSECELRDGNCGSALESSKEAVTASKAFPKLKLAAVLQLGRCYIVMNEYSAAKAAVAGWQRDSNAGNILWQLSLIELESLWKDRPANETVRQDCGQRWSALSEASLAWYYFRKGETRLAEESASRACSLWPNNPVLCLLHGAVCMTLVKSGSGGVFLQKAISSLARAVQGKAYIDVPVACALLAQAESSRDGTRTSILRKWSHNLRKEFLTWPSELYVPAELYFQMALLAKQEQVPQEDESPENERSWKSWLQKALHLNPACERYWKSLGQTSLTKRQV